MITPDPIGPGFDWADSSVKAIMVFFGTSDQDGTDVVLHIVDII